MSGHNKWSKIKRQKGAADQKRGNLFTKLGKAITIAAKEGGGNLESNFTLRLAVDRAKSANMPNDNIDRAIKRGTGELAGEELKQMIFEGYGPGGVALIIDSLSSNRNRASSSIRSILTKYGGKLGASGSVNWMFVRKGVIGLSSVNNKEEVELTAIDAGAEDIVEEDEGLAVFTKPEDLERIRNKLEQNDIAVDYFEIEMVPDARVDLSEKDKNAFSRLQEALDASDEVSAFYSNAKD
ncbi:MAG: YebC/PmpR family DNA-binding transcriptional regulator [Patescibacteria group bacterium]